MKTGEGSRKSGVRTFLIWVVLLVVSAGLVTPWFDFTLNGWMPRAQLLWPLVLIAALVLIVLLGLLRRARAVLFVLVALIAGALPIGTAIWDANPSGNGGSGSPLTVMAINAENSTAEPPSVLAAVSEQDVDVLVLTEVSPGYLNRIGDLGLATILPEGWDADLAEGRAGTVVLSKASGGPVSTPDDFNYAYQNPLATVDASSDRVLVRGVHLIEPTAGDTGAWGDELDGLGEWVSGVREGEPVVLAGNFNAAWSHPAFRRFMDADLDSAHVAAGQPHVRTWPEGRTLPAFVALDHIAVRNLTVIDAGSVSVEGAEHAAVWARFATGN